MTAPLTLDPARTALLVIDMQNAFVMPGGSMARLGLSTSRGHDIIEPVHRLVEACRTRGLPVIHTLTTFRTDYADAGLVAERFPALQPLGHIMSGTWDAQIVDRLLPRAGEYVIPKSRFNAFYGTNLELVLHSLGVDTLIVLGVNTNTCVFCLCFDSTNRDFRVIVAEEGVDTMDGEEMHRWALKSMAASLGWVLHTDEILKALDGKE